MDPHTHQTQIFKVPLFFEDGSLRVFWNVMIVLIQQCCHKCVYKQSTGACIRFQMSGGISVVSHVPLDMPALRCACVVQRCPLYNSTKKRGNIFDLFSYPVSSRVFSAPGCTYWLIWAALERASIKCESKDTIWLLCSGGAIPLVDWAGQISDGGKWKKKKKWIKKSHSSHHRHSDVQDSGALTLLCTVCYLQNNGH